MARPKPAIEGYVLETRFQGDDVRCTVLFKGIEEPVAALHNAARGAGTGRNRMLPKSIRIMFWSLNRTRTDII